MSAKREGSEEEQQGEVRRDQSGAEGEPCSWCRGFGVWGHHDCERCLGSGRVASDGERGERS